MRCRHAAGGGAFVGLFSFELGELTVPPEDPAQVDLVYYYDGDDCSRGAILGNDDEPGYLFPLGSVSRSDLAGLIPPSEGAETVAGISPVTKDREGFAFWVRTQGQGDVLVRLVAVEEASHADLQSGRVPTLQFEWLTPR